MQRARHRATKQGATIKWHTTGINNPAQPMFTGRNVDRWHQENRIAKRRSRNAAIWLHDQMVRLKLYHFTFKGRAAAPDHAQDVAYPCESLKATDSQITGFNA
jgi:hypothetical protein